MMLIPEIATVVILTPRTGSGSLRRAIAARYPKAMLLYRHMEADGVPQGYDRWPKVGVVRDPVERLWSLYKFIADLSAHHEPAYVAAQRASVQGMPFERWIVENQVVFTSPYDSAGLGRFYPQYTVRHPLPENIKSLHYYLRPDLGTQVYRFDQLAELERRLDVSLGRTNNTPESPVPELGAAARDHVGRFFAWDLGVTR
jgi:hypothetical protein